jgi:hypothetical protein
MNEVEFIFYNKIIVKIKPKKQIEPRFIETIWHQLSVEYPAIKNYPMPPIRGFILDGKRFARFEKKLFTFTNIENTGLWEYGHPNKQGNTAGFVWEDENGWNICVDKSDVDGLGFTLKHELLHIVESLLLLQKGTLTDKQLEKWKEMDKLFGSIANYKMKANQ